MVVSNEIRLLSGEIWRDGGGDDDVHGVAYSIEYMYCTWKGVIQRCMIEVLIGQIW